LGQFTEVDNSYKEIKEKWHNQLTTKEPVNDAYSGG